VTGKIVRVTAAPGGFELAVGFGEIKPAVAAVIANLIADRSRQALPASLRVDGVDQPLRCEAHVGDEMVRLTATLPFLRLDGGVDVVLGDKGGVAAAGTIRNISVDPSTTDGVPRLAVDVALDDVKHARTKRYGTPRREDLDRGPASLREGARPANAGEGQAPRLPPTALPPPFGQPLPSVVVAAGLTQNERAAQAQPPRRRMHGTAYIARRPDAPAWAMRPAAAMSMVDPGAAVALPTQRLTTLEMAGSWSRAMWVALPVVALAVAIATLHFSH